MVLTLARDRSPDRDRRRLALARQPIRRRGRLLDPCAVGLLAMTISVAGSAGPSLWFDEAATISAATRPLPELWQMLVNIDAVHGLFYLLMHGWLLIFPPTEFFLRLPSALAVGGAAAGVVILGVQVSSRAVSLCAGIIFAILPRTTWAGIEARSYALSMLVAVCLTVLCIVAARRDRPWLWASYAVGVVVAAVLNVYVLLIVAAHAAAVLMLASRRSTIAWWMASTSIAAVVVAPFLLFSRSQLAQVGWISALGSHTVGEVAREQYFDHSAAFAVLASVVIAGATLFRRPSANLPQGTAHGPVVLALIWMAVPTAILLAHSAWSEPVYYPRYLSFTTPALALLLGVCVVAVARSSLHMCVILSLFTVAAAPNYLVVQRGPYAKEGMDYSQVADVIGAHSSAGDCLVLDNTASWKPGPIRPLTAARPAAYAHLVDPGRGRRAQDRNMLWDRHIPMLLWADRLRACPVLWTVSERDKTRPDHESGTALPPGPRLASAPDYQIPTKYGFHIVERWQFSFAQVAKSSR